MSEIIVSGIKPNFRVSRYIKKSSIKKSSIEKPSIEKSIVVTHVKNY